MALLFVPLEDGLLAEVNPSAAHASFGKGFIIITLHLHGRGKMPGSGSDNQTTNIVFECFVHQALCGWPFHVSDHY
jgi:hypothetical protein